MKCRADEQIELEYEKLLRLYVASDGREILGCVSSGHTGFAPAEVAFTRMSLRRDLRPHTFQAYGLSRIARFLPQQKFLRPEQRLL